MDENTLPRIATPRVAPSSRVRVMYQPSLYNTDDPELEAARRRTFETLFATAGAFKPGQDAAQVGLAGWCLMHGLAALWQGGNLAQVRR